MQISPQSIKKQLQKYPKIAQNLEKWMKFDKSDMVYPMFFGFSALFWANFGAASAFSRVFAKTAEIRAKFEKG